MAVPVGLAAAWEKVDTIRKRFRADMSWIQWPMPEKSDEGEEVLDHHPVCTKSLELNCEAIREMVIAYDGAFCDIHRVEYEARDQEASICWKPCIGLSSLAL